MDYSITLEELIERAAALRQRMISAGLDSLLLATGDNLKYASGYPSPLRSGPRPFLFILKGDPTEGAKAFIDFVLGPKGQAIVAQQGLVAVK